MWNLQASHNFQFNSVIWQQIIWLEGFGYNYNLYVIIWLQNHAADDTCYFLTNMRLFESEYNRAFNLTLTHLLARVFYCHPSQIDMDGG